MAALTFYFANKEAIDAEIDQSDRELEDRRNSHEAENGSVWDRIEARSRQ
jgi:hypothetical protein